VETLPIILFCCDCVAAIVVSYVVASVAVVNVDDIVVTFVVVVLCGKSVIDATSVVAVAIVYK